jgi:hypothetical protein
MVGLCSGFITYFADNVIVMLMACTASLLGTKAGEAFGWPPTACYAVGLVHNIFLTLLLRWIIIKLTGGTASDIESDSDQSDDTTKDRSVVCSHMLAMLPWIVRCGALNLLVSVNTDIVNATKDMPFYGKQCLYDIIVFVVLVILAWVFSEIWAKKTAPGSGDSQNTTGIFLLNCLQGSFLSTSGKALHFIIALVLEALTGPDGEKLLAYVVTELIIMTVAAFFLMYCLPRFSHENHSDKISHIVLSYLVVYTWAFSFVNFLWWYFYTYLGGPTQLDNTTTGQILFWAFVAFLLLVAIAFAWAHKGDFYGGDGAVSKAVGNMLCWTIDFAAWWGWSQVMANMDASIGKGHMDALANLGITVGLTVLAGGIYLMSSKEAMEEHDEHRANPVPPRKSAVEDGVRMLKKVAVDS